MLVGSLAFDAWRNDRVFFPEGHKDLDIVVLTFACISHPWEFEGGFELDWFVSHRNEDPASNGRFNLNFNLVTKRKNVAPGLYLPPSKLLVESYNQDITAHARFRSWSPQIVPAKPRLEEFPVMPGSYFRVRWFSTAGKNFRLSSRRCKMYGGW